MTISGSGHTPNRAAQVLRQVLLGVMLLPLCAGDALAQAPSGACFPPCRAGYVCAPSGQCVSGCNPPCMEGETCNARGECNRAAPPVGTTETPGDTTHRGFYFRFAVGGGFMTGPASLPFGDMTTLGHLSGAAVLGELAFGGTLFKGLVMGAGGWSASIPSSRFESDLHYRSGNSFESGSVQSVVVGPFVDWYPTAKPGFHAQAAMGLGRLAITKGNETVTDCDAAGSCSYKSIPSRNADQVSFGAMLGVGYEFSLAGKWSLGAVARTTLVAGGDLPVAYPGVLLNVTYH